MYTLALSCRDDRQVNEMYEFLIEQMKEKVGITEQLKADSQMEWVQRVSNIQARAREIVYYELIMHKHRRFNFCDVFLMKLLQT